MKSEGVLTVGLIAVLLCMAGLFAATGSENDSGELFDAVKRSDVAKLRLLIAEGNDANGREPDGTTALHWAARRNNATVVDMLIGAGADVEAANRYGVTPLLTACEYGSLEIVQSLLDAGADPNGALPEGETPLMTAARTGKREVVSLLVARGADVNAREAWRGQTALMWAAGENHGDVIRTLVELGADVNARSEGGFTALLFAARDGKKEALATLVELGAAVDEVVLPSAELKEKGAPGSSGAGGSGIVYRSRSKPFRAPLEMEGMSALTLAVGSAHYEVANYLLEQGADPNAAGQGWAPLHQLQYTRRHQRTRGLPPPEQTGDMGSLEIAEALLRHGADPNARQVWNVNDGQRNALDRIGATPYLLAAKNADPPMMRLLFENGADIRIPTRARATPLAVAAGLGLFAVSDDIGTNEEAFEATKLAYEFGDHDVNAADDRGWTALHGAVLRGADEIVKFLVARGAALEAQTEDGWTPLTIADGVFYTGTFKRSESTAALLRDLLREQGLPVPPVPDRKRELEEAGFKR